MERTPPTKIVQVTVSRVLIEDNISGGITKDTRNERKFLGIHNLYSDSITQQTYALREALIDYNGSGKVMIQGVEEKVICDVCDIVYG